MIGAEIFWAQQNPRHVEDIYVKKSGENVFSPFLWGCMRQQLAFSLRKPIFESILLKIRKPRKTTEIFFFLKHVFVAIRLA
jgi:hypothetical protein